MCGCSTHQTQSTKVAETDPNALTLRVEDMTCGHCAGSIIKAIETALPGTRVEANPVLKLVSVHGSSDFDAIRAAITRVGYTAANAVLG